RFAFGALLLHLGKLRRGELRVLGERLVDLLHVGWAVERQRGAGEQRGGDGEQYATFHGCLQLCGQTTALLEQRTLVGSPPRSVHECRPAPPRAVGCCGSGEPPVSVSPREL